MAKQKPKPKQRIQSRGKKASKTIRAKGRTNKSAAKKRMAVAVKGVSRRTKTARTKKISPDRQSPKNNRPVRRATPERTKTTRSSSRVALLDESRFTKRKIRNRGWSEPVTKSKKNSGYSSKITIKNSKYLKGTFTLKKSETSLTKKNSIRLKRGESRVSEVSKKLGGAAKRKFKSLGKSKENLRMLKLQYTYTVNGKRRKSYFSSTVAKLKNEEEVQKMLEILVQDFEAKLKSYESSGFSDIRISGVRMHAYED